MPRMYPASVRRQIVARLRAGEPHLINQFGPDKIL